MSAKGVTQEEMTSDEGADEFDDSVFEGLASTSEEY